MNMKHKFVSTNKKKRKKLLIETRHNFYLTFFDDDEEYAEKEVNGYWLVKQWNPEMNRPQVSLYSKESFKKYKGSLG